MPEQKCQLYISIQPCAIFKCDITLKLDLLQVLREKTPDIVGMNSDSDVWPKICRPARGTCTLQAVMNYSNKRQMTNSIGYNIHLDIFSQSSG